MYYRIMGDAENFANFLPKDYTMEMAQRFDGRSLMAEWKPLHFELTDYGDNRPLPEIITGYIPVCSARVYEAIKDACKGIVEFLPCTLGHKKHDYFVFNILGAKNSVDYERSVYHRFPSTGKIMFFKTIVFKDDITDPLFRISDLPYTYFFCTEEFKKLLESIGTKGAVFSTELF